jgi:hypothetical protein
MFGLGEKMNGGPLAGLPQEVIAAIKEAGLENDPQTLMMIESGFITPNGSNIDSLEFIAQRKALIDSGEAGLTTPEISADSMVQHSPAPESEPRAELN